MYSLGIDLGTTFTKTSHERCFPSGISETIYLSSNIMEFEGKKYTMELHDLSDININKSLNKNARLNLIYSLYKEGMGNQVLYENINLSLPCSQWKNQRTVDQFKQMIPTNEIIDVTVNDVKKEIIVENINVYPEGATAYFSKEMDNDRFNGEKVLILDWGGLTLNQILFANDDIVDMHTDELGVLKIYKKIAEKITSETGINVRIEDMDDIIQNGLFYQKESVIVSDIIEEISLPYCFEIYKNLKLRWGIDTIKHVPAIGGGNIALSSYLQNYITHLELQENAQMLAVIGLGEA